MKYNKMEEYQNVDDLILDSLNDYANYYQKNYISRIFERFVYEEDLSSEEDFYCLVYHHELSQALINSCRVIIDLIDNSTLKEQIIGLYNDNADILFLNKAQLDSIRSEGQEIEYQMICVVMGRFEFLYADLDMVVKNSIHKVYFDYISTLMIEKKIETDSETKTETIRAVDNEVFLKEQLDRINGMISVVVKGYDNQLDDMVNLKKQLSETKIIPPGVIRSMAVGTPMFIINNMLYRITRVINYFLGKLNEQKVSSPDESQ